MLTHPYEGQEGFPPLPGAEQQMAYNSYMNGTGATNDTLYGSPRDDVGKMLSPIGNSYRTLGPLDAGLPASLDSNGISYYARHGPIAASVPSKFGMDSPPPSLPRDARALALRSLHQSAFGDDQDLGESARASRSPPVVGDEMSFGRRIMHSQFARQHKVMSSSFPRAGLLTTDVWAPEQEDKLSNNEADTFSFEEDFVPSSLQELLTPQERNRRMSRTDNEEPVGSWGHRNSITAPTTPGETSLAGSPGSSRFGALFNRQKRDDEANYSSIGHVGSPLRNSYAHGTSPPFGAIGRPEPADGLVVASPTRQTSASNLSQHFQRIRLNRNDSSFNNGVESSNLSAMKPTMNGTPPSRPIPDRPIPNLTGNATSTTPSSIGKPFTSIDEDTQFFMEGDDKDTLSKKPSAQKLGLAGDEVDPLSAARGVEHRHVVF